jgi:hypothetical protein
MITVTPEQRLVSAILLGKARALPTTPTQPLDRHLAQARDVRDFASMALRAGWLKVDRPVHRRGWPLPVVTLTDVDVAGPDWRPATSTEYRRAVDWLAEGVSLYPHADPALLGHDVGAVGIAAHAYLAEVEMASVLSPVVLPMRVRLWCNRCHRRTVDAVEQTCGRCGWEWHGL